MARTTPPPPASAPPPAAEQPAPAPARSPSKGSATWRDDADEGVDGGFDKESPREPRQKLEGTGWLAARAKYAYAGALAEGHTAAAGARAGMHFRLFDGVSYLGAVGDYVFVPNDRDYAGPRLLVEFSAGRGKNFRARATLGGQLVDQECSTCSSVAMVFGLGLELLVQPSSGTAMVYELDWMVVDSSLADYSMFGVGVSFGPLL